MKTLTLPLVIVLAIVLLVCLLLRGRHGRTLVLRGRHSHRVVRTAAILLLLLGLSPAHAADEPQQESTDFQRDAVDDAVDITPEIIAQWRMVPLSLGWAHGRDFKKHYLVLRRDPLNEQVTSDFARAHELRAPQSALSHLLWIDLSARLQGLEPTTPSAQELLDAATWLEEAALFDAWFIAYIWKRTGEMPATRTEEQRTAQKHLFKRLARSARVTNALVLALADVKPVPLSPRAWMSKAAPRPEVKKQWNEDNAALHRSMQRIYPAVDIGTWANDGGVMLTLGEAMPAITLTRAGVSSRIEPGTTFHFQRLDLIETPEAQGVLHVHHEWLGPIALPMNEMFSVWTITLQLSPEQKAEAKSVIERAVENGDDELMTALERSLPLVWPLLTEKAGQLEGDARSRVRTLLALFDDTMTTTSVLDLPQEPW